MPSSPQPVVALVDIRETPLSVDEAYAACSDARAGGVSVFVGAVRDHDEGRQVGSLAYCAHPSASDRLRAVVDAVALRHDVLRLAAVHRVGDLAIGDLAVVCVAAAAHRDVSFAACRDLIDTLKGEVPIWKRQDFTDGRTEWVGLP